MNFTFLISCDQKYYDDWAINLLNSIKHFNNLNVYNLHCHVVNPNTDLLKLDGVKYTFETKKFLDRSREISYLQCSRFLAVEKYYPNNDIVVTLDADSICTRPFTEAEIQHLLLENYVLTRGKSVDNRWLAGMIVFKDRDFKKDYNNTILSKDDKYWEYGWDQIVLRKIANKHRFKQLSDNWMSIGKNGNNRVFLTLKGLSQKTEKKYTGIYDEIINKIRKDADA